MSSILKVNTIQDLDGNLIISKDSGGSGFLSPYASSSAAITYTVTVASKTSAHPYNGVGSSLGYLINGIEAPIIEIKGNDTSKPYHYKFDQSDSTNNGHPLLFYNNVGKTTQFTTGVTTNGTPGQAGAYTMIAVDSQTPNILYYQCSQHANMGNHTFATSPVVNTGVFLTLPTADGSSGQFVKTNGSGVLAFADGSVPDNAITLAKMASGTDGNIISYDASGNPVAVATGNDGQVLTSAGAGAQPAFETLPAGTTLSGSTNNTVATVTGANALIGEANLTFDGTVLKNAAGVLRLQNATTGTADTDGLLIEASGNDVYFNQKENATIFFRTNNTDRLKITSGGDMRSYGWAGNGTGDGWKLMNDDNQGTMNLETNLTTARTLFNFINGNGTVGTIATDGSATAFNTSSDYRLKENVNYDFDATTRLKQLKPARFNFKTDADTTVDGFIAHEVSSVIPEAISGEKDAMHPEVLYVDEVLYTAEDELPEGMNIGDTKSPADELPEGKNFGDVKEVTKPNHQGIDQSKLVPLLVKTIQELEARITTLENA